MQVPHGARSESLLLRVDRKSPLSSNSRAGNVLRPTADKNDPGIRVPSIPSKV